MGQRSYAEPGEMPPLHPSFSLHLLGSLEENPRGDHPPPSTLIQTVPNSLRRVIHRRSTVYRSSYLNRKYNLGLRRYGATQSLTQINSPFYRNILNSCMNDAVCGCLGPNIRCASWAQRSIK